MEINGGSLRYTAEMDISKLKAALKEGEKGYQGFSDVVGKTGDEMDKAFENAQKVIENQKKSITELEKKYQELQNTINNTPSESGNSALADEMVRLKAEIDTYEKGMANMQKVLESYTNKNIVLTKELDELKRKLVDVGKAQVENQKITDTLDITSENIKIQKQAIADLEKQYKDLEKTIEGIAPGQAKANLMGDAAELAKEIEAEKQALIELQNYVGVTAERHESLRQKLNQVKNEMIALAAAGQQNTGEYAQLAQEADTLQTAIDEVNGTMDALSGNTGLNAIVEGLGLASSGMAIYQGAVALTGVESKNLEEIMVRLQAVMAISIGIQQVQNTLTRQGALIQSVMALQATARARAEALATSNTIAATVAQRAFNLVANANPYVLLATAIITVVGALALMSSGNKRAAEDQKKLNDVIADGAAEQIVSYKKLQNQYNELGDSLQEKNKFIEENQDKFHDLGIEIENTADAEVVFRSGETAMINSLMLRAEAAANAQIAIEKYKEALKEEGEIRNFDEDWKKSGFFGKVGLGFKASFNNIDNKKGAQLRKEADANIKSELKLYKKSAEELEKAKIKTQASGPAKGSEEFYRAEITRLNDLKSKAQKGSKEWENYRKEIERLDSLVNPKEKKTKKPAKAKELAEIFDVGSLARLQQQISLIDNSIQRMGKDGLVSLRAIDKYGKEYTSNQIISLEEAKNKRLELSSQVAEIEKNIQIKSITDQVNESNKLWEQYYAAVQSLGEEAANRIYGKLIENGKTQFDSLVDMQKQLSTKTILTDEEKDVLLTINSAIDAMLGKQSALDKFKSDLQNTLRRMGSDAERLLFIQEQLKKSSSTDKSEGRTAFLAENERQLLQNQQDFYNSFIQEQQTFEQRKTDIEKKFNTLRAELSNNNNIDNAERLRLLDEIGKEEAGEYSAAFLAVFKKTKLWEKAFGNIDALTKKEISQLIPVLQAQIEELIKLDAPIEEIERFKQKLEDLKYFTAGSNPITRLIENFKELRKKIKEGTATDADFKKLQDNVSEVAVYVRMATEAAKELSEALGIGDKGGPFEKFAKDLTQTIEGLVNAIVGYLTGNMQQMVGGIIQMAVGIIKMLSTAGDGTKEKGIRAWKRAVDDLKFAYEELQMVIEKTAGEGQLAMQRDLISNLKEQQRILQDMRSKESSKKKVDQEKVYAYTQQINEINLQIQQIIDDFQTSITGTDFKSFSQRLADALIDAFGKGEDAAFAFDKVVDDVMRNAVENALRIKILEPAVKEMVDKLYSSMGFGGQSGATTQQAAELKNYQDQIAEIENKIPTVNSLVAANLKSTRDYLLEKVKILQQQIAANTVSGSFDGLTQEERDKIKALGTDAMHQYTAALQQYQDLFGGAAENAQSMKGDIKGITEKTAGALEGQVNAVRINQVSGLQVARQSLLNLVQIEVNTRRLHNMDKTLMEMNAKMKKSLAGVP